MGEFDGRVALVTGAAGDGIGQATARRLAAGGAAVAVTDIHVERTQRVTEAMRKEYGDRIAGYPMDVADRARVDEVLAQVTRDLGPIDILISNVAINPTADVSEFSPEDWDRTTAVDFTAAYYLTRNLLGGMIERGAGSIVYVTSVAAYGHGYGREAPYAGAGAGLHGMARAAAHEGGPHGVRANAVAPGMIWGKFARDRIELLKPRVDDVPLRRIGDPEEVAEVIAFLCSEQSSYITGETLNVSGGYYMRP